MSDVATVERDEHGTPRLNVNGRTVHRVIKDLLVGEFGLTREGIVQKFLEMLTSSNAVRDWMNGQNVREFVGRVARETVSAMAERLIREEVRVVMNGRIRITLEETSDPRRGPSEAPRPEGRVVPGLRLSGATEGFVRARAYARLWWHTRQEKR